MNFKLTYTGSPGEVQATLTLDGTTVATTYGLKDEKSARKWARNEAAAIKAEKAAPASKAHSVYTTISGHDAFSL